MTSLSNSFVISKRPSPHFSTDSYVKSPDQCLGSNNLAFGFKGTRKAFSQRKALVVQASYSDGGRPNGASIFVGGFVLGGLIVGTLGCVYAPQISKVITDTDKKDLMKKLPKFIYDEEKILERQRKKLADKIEQLNLAIDNVSSQLRSEDKPPTKAVSSQLRSDDKPHTKAAVRADDIEAAV